MSKFPLNLQLFAEGEEDPEPADPEVVEIGVEDPVGGEEPAGTEGEEDPEPADPEIDSNAIYAQARRAAERRMEGINSRVSRRFGNMKNPETGQPIRTAEDYFDALEAQERVNARRQIEERGVDPALIDQMISNNPVIRQAQEVLHENTMREGERELSEQIQQISAIDPLVKSLADIAKMETFPQFDAYVRRGLSLPEAYRLANFESLSQRDAAASRQAAINAAKGKSHLSPIGGGMGEASHMVEIPNEELGLWQEVYPELSYKELREKYNKSL